MDEVETIQVERNWSGTTSFMNLKEEKKFKKKEKEYRRQSQHQQSNNFALKFDVSDGEKSKLR